MVPSLYLASSKAVQSVLKTLKDNPSTIESRDQCATHCPNIARMITDMFVMVEMSDQALALLPMPPPPPAPAPAPATALAPAAALAPSSAPPQAPAPAQATGENVFDPMEHLAELLEHKEQLAELLESTLRMDNQICDIVHKECKCRPGKLDNSCDELVENLGLFPDVVKNDFERCDELQPCRDECTGADALRVDYVMALVKLNFKAIPTKAEGDAMCAATDPVKKCVDKPKCTEFLTINPPYSITPEVLSKTAETYCPVFEDPCYETQEKRCPREADALNELHTKGESCARVLLDGAAWPQETVQRCCGAVIDLAKCDVKYDCRDLILMELEVMKLNETAPMLCPGLMDVLNPPTTTSVPFDCSAGFKNWQAGWSIPKKNWCCQNCKRGCRKIPDPFDCLAGLNNWVNGWSGKKKDWCCKYKKLGCPGQPAPGPGKVSPLCDNLTAANNLSVGVHC